MKPGLAGQATDLTQNSVVAEFNDPAGLEKLLVGKDIACVIMEPVLTNSCMVLPEPGFLDTVRKLTRDNGTLLLIDETHTISTGRGGYSRTHNLDPDIFVLGKPVAGGVPASVWGLSEDVADRYAIYNSTREGGYSGIGTTLSANPDAVCRHARLSVAGHDGEKLRPHGKAGGTPAKRPVESDHGPQAVVACGPRWRPRRIHLRTPAR